MSKPRAVLKYNGKVYDTSMNGLPYHSRLTDCCHMWSDFDFGTPTCKLCRKDVARGEGEDSLSHAEYISLVNPDG